jgi:cellulose synthase/poly-beta-1,6-N-acetylglucosamine synthase-like glycosyltransferase
MSDKTKEHPQNKTKKVKNKHNFSGSLAIIVSLILAVIITSCVGFLLIQGNDLENPKYTTILNTPDLLQSLQVAKADGVIIAIHGWEHEDYENLTHEQAATDLQHSITTFDKAGLHTTVFVEPYQVSNVSASPSVIYDIAHAGLTLPFDGADMEEYTWEWRNMESINDPRYAEAMNDIDGDAPHLIVVHAQDWNIYTKKFLDDYLETTPRRNIIVRMDDVFFNTKPEVVQGMDDLRKYPSVSEVVLAVIPAVPMAKESSDSGPRIFNISVNKIMESYALFFLVLATFPLMFFSLWRLIAGVMRRKYEKRVAETEIKYPDFLSIIVPAYNEKSSIARCIESLLTQDYRGAKEIIVVNDGSTDNTADIVAQYPVTLLNLKKNVGKASALNEGIKVARGDIILFSDGDSNMCSDALTSMIRCFSANPDVDVVTGEVMINKPEKFSFITCCQMIEYYLDQEVVRYIQNLVNDIVICPGPITAVKRHVCDKVPYTNDTILEDADFTAAMRRNNFKILLDKNAKIYTNAPGTVKQWYKQRTRWWYGNLQVWHIHKEWAIKNPWMVYSYIGFVTSLCSLLMMLAVPYLIFQYGNIGGVLAKGLLSFAIPVVFNSTMLAVFFRHDKKLMLMLIPYMVIYPIMKMFVLSYFYLRYVTGIGLTIRHGTRKIRAK